MFQGKNYIGTFAFLFNADVPELGTCYGDECFKRVGLALKKYNSKLCTWILEGDILLHIFCDEIVRYDSTDDVRRPKIYTTYSRNKQLFFALVWDLSEAIVEQWNTIDIEGFPLTLMSNNINCITTPTIPIKIAEVIDVQLRSGVGYLGCIMVDMGNPLQRKLFCNMLVGSRYIIRGTLKIEVPYDDKPSTPSWMADVFETIEYIPYNKFENGAPDRYPTKELSKRGRLTQTIIDEKGQPTHRQKVALALYSSKLTNVQGKSIIFSAERNNTIDEAIVPEEKLVGYVLNSKHIDGKHKALLFRNLLDITSGDWRYLASQLVTGLGRVNVKKVRISPHGIQYHADIPVIGKNGKSKIVRSAWIAINSQPIRLTTAYILENEDQTKEVGEKPPIVLNHSPEDTKWNELYRLARNAGENAAINIVPTPMIVYEPYDDSNELVKEGACGGAYIIVTNARKGFGRWLRKNGIGSSHKPSGQCIYAEIKSQSKERAEAYAYAFATVLHANGVNCSVESYLS